MGAAGLAVGRALPPGATGVAGADGRRGPGAPSSATVDGLAVPIGLASDDVYFAWELGDSRRGARQSAYRIRVSGPIAESGAAPAVWDSGQVASSDQAFVAYGGPGLAADTAYHWTVQTWDADGHPSPQSSPSTFETGLGQPRLAGFVDPPEAGE